MPRLLNPVPLLTGWVVAVLALLGGSEISTLWAQDKLARYSLEINHSEASSDLDIVFVPGQRHVKLITGVRP